MDDSVCWLFIFVLLVFYYLDVHVKCKVYHFSDCINRATAVLNLCWPTPRHWTYELAYTEQCQQVGLRRQVRKTAIGQL